MASVLMTTIGSWGDLFPFIGVGKRLQQAGHDVRIGASPAWAELVTDSGIDFVPVGRWIGFDEFRQHPEIFARVPFGLRAGLHRFLFDQADQVTEDLTAAIEGVDVLVSHPAEVLALNVAERHHVRRVVATVFPSMIRSTHTVPGGTPVGPWAGVVGRAMNRHAWRQALGVVALLFDRPINGHRRALGLRPVRAALIRLPARADATVVMASPSVIPRPVDWPANVVMTSFVEWDGGSEASVTPETDAFLDAGEPPVLITLGTSTATDAETFFDEAAHEVTASGARALIVTGPAGAPRAAKKSPLLHVSEFEPFKSLAPRCQAAIHHAGVGTTVACMRAGIPQLGIPKGFDQPVTAALLEQLGVGIALPWRRRHARMHRTVNRLLSDNSLRVAAEELAQRLEPDGAVATAAVISMTMDPPSTTIT